MQSRSAVLTDADYCWRLHHCSLFLAATACDFFAENDQPVEQTANITFKDLASTYPLAQRVLSLCKLLESPSLHFHPSAVGRIDIMDAAISLMSTIRSESLLYHYVRAYFLCDEQTEVYSSRVMQRAKMYPYHRLLIEYIQAKKSLAESWSLDGLIPRDPKEWPRQLYFTTSIEMAIGHYGTMLDFLAYLDHLSTIDPESCADITVFLIRSGRGQGKYIFDHVKLGNRFLKQIAYLDLLDLPLHSLCSLIDWNPSLQWVGRTARLAFCDSVACIKEPLNKQSHSGKAFLHLRTNSYKNDGHVGAMGLRSVRSPTYSSAVRLLTSNNIELCYISADAESDPPLNISHIFVTDERSERSQWEHINNSDFLIGTQSGISHFSALTKFSCLLTNYVSLPFERAVSCVHLVCTKNLIAHPELPGFTKRDILYMFIEPWVLGENSLASIVDIYDNTEDQLYRAAKEFLDLRNGKQAGLMFHDVLRRSGLDREISRLPNWNLFTDTGSQLLSLLNTAR